jgi:fructose-1,6-bisphosphatase/inositol monophosphatase family enzyme
MPIELHDPVVALMREVARDVIMPRYQNLRAEEISEKAVDDLVTIADKESEIRLAEGLASILPEAGIIGEEACAADPAILERAGDGLNWIIDPIDGTGNFAAGRPPFGIMIALADAGTTLAGWILDLRSARTFRRVRTGISRWWTFRAAQPSNIRAWSLGRMTCQYLPAPCHGIMRQGRYCSMKQAAVASGWTGCLTW